jgi:hypothetical protein
MFNDVFRENITNGYVVCSLNSSTMFESGVIARSFEDFERALVKFVFLKVQQILKYGVM